MSGSNDNTIKIWDINSGQLIKSIDDFKDIILTIKFTKEQLIISGSANGVIKVKDYKTTETRQVLTGHTGAIKSLLYF